MSDKGDSVAEVEDLRREHVGGNGSGSGSGSGNIIIDDDDNKKVLSAHTSDVPPQTGASSGVRRGLQPPEFLLNMSMEERLELETKLKRKIDLRLMPAIILMYILNYIDRLVLPHFSPGFPPRAQAPHPPDSRPHLFSPSPRGVLARGGPDPPTNVTKREMSPPTTTDRQPTQTGTTSRPPSSRAWRRTSGCRRPSTRRPCPSSSWATC